MGAARIIPASAGASDFLRLSWGAQLPPPNPWARNDVARRPRLPKPNGVRERAEVADYFFVKSMTIKPGSRWRYWIATCSP